MIPHNSPSCGPEEADAAARVIQSGWLAQGAEVEAFENEVCEFLGLPPGHAVALSSGTAALFMALWALDAKDKCVAFPVYVCSALRNAVAMAGAGELLLDVGMDSPNLDPADFDHLAPDILIAPHMYGLPLDIPACGDIPVIEDCAQSLGAKFRGVSTGLHGIAGVFSFYATKLITSGGQGGMFVSRDKGLADQVRDYRNFDCRPDKKLRFNFQMTDVQAAVGRVQLKKLPYLLERRACLFRIYQEAGLKLLDVEPDAAGLEPIRYRAVVRTNAAESVIKALAQNEIRAIVPIEDWELLGGGSAFPNALHLTKTTVSLPLFPTLKDEQAEKIAACVKRLA